MIQFAYNQLPRRDIVARKFGIGNYIDLQEKYDT